MTQLVGRLNDGQYMAFGLSGDMQRTRYICTYHIQYLYICTYITCTMVHTVLVHWYIQYFYIGTYSTWTLVHTVLVIRFVLLYLKNQVHSVHLTLYIQYLALGLPGYMQVHSKLYTQYILYKVFRPSGDIQRSKYIAYCTHSTYCTGYSVCQGIFREPSS